MIFQPEPAILALEDGTTFNGTSIGIQGAYCGEVIFNTAMTGYEEILTDPSYANKIITLTYPHIGNVGINYEDMESDRIWAAGLVIHQLSSLSSHWRAKSSLQDYLMAQNIVGISDIDTRALTHLLRTKGTLMGRLIAGTENCKSINLSNPFDVHALEVDLIQLVSTPNVYKIYPPAPHRSSLYSLVVYDFGVKRSILNYFIKRGFDITVVPAYTSTQHVLSLNPDGILFSNGPGDPQVYKKAINIIQEFLDCKIPLFGLCLGHQLLSLAMGAKTIRMKFGQHGVNHPVQNIATGQVLITCQNHDFTVDEVTLPAFLKATHRSLFDGSLQGICHVSEPIYGFQGHPEASPGPVDSSILFEPFIKAMHMYHQKKSSSIYYAKTF